MDRRSWPWKKKSSDKAAEKAAAASAADPGTALSDTVGNSDEKVCLK